MNSPHTSWFHDWFNSPYYHLLYSNRDEKEAEEFVQRLVNYLHPAPGSRLLDLACGKGRHSIALHKAGFDVTGIDLSSESIREAKKYETEGLAFFEHDMRRPFMINYFDGVFNLFTSFGYFADRRDNRLVVDAVCKGLHPGGFFVIDFFNAKWVAAEIGECVRGEKETGGISFRWEKKVYDGNICKSIVVKDGAQERHFIEQVQLLGEPEFRSLLAADFEIEKLFGDYSLSEFDERTSKRLIIIARKR